jgi:hypothetical protein
MPDFMSPAYCLLQVPYAGADGTNIIGQDPLVVEEYDVTVRVYPWRGNPTFIGATLVALDLPPNLLGDYHLLSNDSPAYNAAIGTWDGIAAPNQDYDGQPRPSRGGFDIGADELSSAFPATPPLFPLPARALAEGLQPNAPSQAPYTLYMPFVPHGGAVEMIYWGGDTDSFVPDPASGIVEVQASGMLYWLRNAFENNQEAYFTFTPPALSAPRQDLLLKVGSLTPEGALGADSYLVNVSYDATTESIRVNTLSAGTVWHTHKTFGGIIFAAGDRFGARATQGGIVEIYHNDWLVGRVDLSAPADPAIPPWSNNGDGGRLGVWFEGPDFGSDPASFTDFGGGTLP